MEPTSILSALYINADGKIVIVKKSSEANRIAWYDNVGTSSLNQNKLERLLVYPNPFISLINVKSDKNIRLINIYNELKVLVLFLQKARRLIYLF